MKIFYTRALNDPPKDPVASEESDSDTLNFKTGGITHVEHTAPDCYTIYSKEPWYITLTKDDMVTITKALALETEDYVEHPKHREHRSIQPVTGIVLTICERVEMNDGYIASIPKSSLLDVNGNEVQELLDTIAALPQVFATHTLEPFENL